MVNITKSNVTEENQPEKRADIQEEDEYEEDEEDEMANMQISESDFKFEEFTKRLAHPKIVRACGLALKHFEKNSVQTNHCIVKLLHRIAFDCKMYTMVFQISIFKTFQKIYESKDMPQFKELIKYCNYIIGQFINITADNPKVFIEALFWKSCKDAFEIDHGYGSYREKSAAASKAWTELEENELRTLFMEHQEKQLQEDVVDWIVDNLIDNTRTRRGVLKKLKEMYLLTQYKRTRKPGTTGNIPKQWSMDEEVQLRELYEEFKNAMDPLGCIMARLDVQRPKNRIIEKLLVIGLVQDRKELRKKRAKKSMPGNDNNYNESSGSDSEYESQRSISAPQNSSQNKKGTHALKRATKKSQKGKKKTSNHVQVSSKDLAKLLIEIVDSGMSEALEWIRESFSDVADDLENEPDSDDSGIPLVPILDCSISAMESLQFQKLLKALGVTEPANEQESYWRIPSYFTRDQLKKHCDTISQALEGSLVVEEEPNHNVANNNSESSDEDVFDKIRQIVNKNNEIRNEAITKANNYSSTTANVTGNSSREVLVADIDNQNTNIEKMIVSGSDNNTNQDIAPELEEQQRLPMKKKVRRIVESDSDEESDVVNSQMDNIAENEEDINEENIKRPRHISDSDTDKPKFKKARILDSDDED